MYYIKDTFITTQRELILTTTLRAPVCIMQARKKRKNRFHHRKPSNKNSKEKMTGQKIFFLDFRFLLLGIPIVRSCLSSDRTREVSYRTHPLFLQFLLLLFSISLFLPKIHRSRGWKRTSEIIGGQEAGGRFDEMSNANPGYILSISFRLLLQLLASKLRGFAS